MTKTKIGIKKNDTVEVIAGRDRGKRGKVLKVDTEKQRTIVEGVNFIKKHQKANQRYREGGIIEREGTLHVSNVMVVCPGCERPARIGRKELEDGKTVRICRRCGEPVEKA
jgi:large subunit ribosomal protein L24